MRLLAATVCALSLSGCHTTAPEGTADLSQLPDLTAKSDMAVAPTCADGAKNGSETDVDCGGPMCPKCGSGQKCGGPDDCGSKVCMNGTCIAPSCSDSVKNGNETDVDCGGTCPMCDDGKGCNAPVDCKSGLCQGGKCVAPSCMDKMKNGDESDVDCGGSCGPCPDGKVCGKPADCGSGVCTNGACAAPTCMDKVENGMETDVDCGPGCPPCGDGKMCTNPADCASKVCTNGLCIAPTCMDKVKNGNEGDVDCGGACGKCPDGKLCAMPSDCASGVCLNGACAVPTCMDKVKNGLETDVDCGGPCARCPIGQGCTNTSDCLSSLCDQNKCRAATGCKELHAAQPNLPDGNYEIDPDSVGNLPTFTAQCDMTIDGGGWTRFHWIKQKYPMLGLDPLGELLHQCNVSAMMCRGRIPTVVNPTDLLIKDLSDKAHAAWKFNGSAISNGVLGAFRDKSPFCAVNQPAFQPYLNTSVEPYCGTGAEGGCDSFFYGPANTCGIPNWGMNWDGDTAYGGAAIKLGSLPSANGYSCAAIDQGYLNEIACLDEQGEMYYR